MAFLTVHHVEVGGTHYGINTVAGFLDHHSKNSRTGCRAAGLDFHGPGGLKLPPHYTLHELALVLTLFTQAFHLTPQKALSQEIPAMDR